MNVKRRAIAALLVMFLIVAGLAVYANRSLVRSAIEQLQGNDFPGPGHGSVEIVVNAGDDGEVITQQLVDKGVVKNFRTTYKLILDENPIFYPGRFSMKLEMRSLDAINLLTDPDSAAVQLTTIKEGLRTRVAFKVLSEATGLPYDDFEEWFYKPAEFGLSSKLPSIEGYLFPATYDFAPGLKAKQIIQIMVDRMQEELNTYGVSKADAHKVLTLAALVQKEVRQTQDFYKASRTFLNRIAKSMPLQSDATVSYGVNGKTVSTSAADRANDNPYNTYLHAGLPAGPISLPGSVAIDAALHPADGKWLYFCTVNLETGETIFSETYAQHGAAVAKWQAWMKENPGYE
ncbi:MAG: hypothetical protein RL100_579 [Actinomycetota bacterium]|jgi:UPF0755 protein